ncbi:peroxiredoxin [Croceicoccus sp. F390]|uniref:thioredoxin-dependent peroxiredoxin n=1 Tax=Croceicoccus esteveae TaxID=3075597 RepID=A0ABU2ZDC1_9SPHN|nr:peroxiredoxin [Croceicoccus sp. F390]MDT0574597.1 peroxiredoxin [Croceicoccus sp. F390]
MTDASTNGADDRIGAGDRFPIFSLQMVDNGTMSNADIAGKPVVFFFYPKDNTPGCTSEAVDFTRLKPRFDAAGITLVGVSKDPLASHARFMAKHALSTPLGSDAQEDGLADALGIWVMKSMMGRRYMGMERTTVLVAGDGSVARIWRKVKVKGHADEVLAAALAEAEQPAGSR